MVPLRRLEIHATHACNLTCESCSHFTNHGHTGSLDPETADAWMAPWSKRLQPKVFSVLGGEPTLNPKLSAIVAVAARRWPRSTIEVVTNGFYLGRHPDLPAALGKRGKLVLTHHSDDPAYTRFWMEALDAARDWQARGLEVEIRRSTAWWTRRYEGFGPNMRPVHGSGDARAAWSTCTARDCRQLHAGHLWKCPVVAYIGLQTERWPGLVEHFYEATAHLGLPPGATDEQLRRYLDTEAEPACSTCPPIPQRFTPGSPLIPARMLLRREEGR